MIIEWKIDSESYKYKTIHTLEYSHITIKIICDVDKDQIVSSYVAIKGEDFLEIAVHDNSLDEAKYRLIWAAINIGSSFLTKQNIGDVYKSALIDNLINLYKIQEDRIKREKSRLRELFETNKRGHGYDR